ncbi:lipopolysaccharide biosynthesis protein [Halobaculum sp. EA56]|uniref:lipopolysaccharide biosynthesis protein n=1 Tax=Halobaculum sp. EA56 TaxID=3421648 RepID=UPI003EB8DA2B
MKFEKVAAHSYVFRLIAALCDFIGVLIIAYFYSSDLVGGYYLTVSVISVGVLFSDLGLSEAVRKRLSERETKETLLGTSIIIRLLLTILIVLAIIKMSNFIYNFIGFESTLSILALMLTIRSFREFIFAVLDGEHNVWASSFSRFIASISKLTFWIISIFLNFGFIGLLAGLILSDICSILFAQYFVVTRPSTPTFKSARSIYKYAKFSVFNTFRMSAWVWTDTLVLGFFVANSYIGVYETVWRITGVVFLAASTAGNVLFPEVSELAYKEKLEKLQPIFEKGIYLAGLISVPGVIGVILIGEEILEFFGHEYTIGYYIFVILMFSRLVHSYEIIISKFITGLDRPDLDFRSNLAFITANISFNVIFVYYIGWIGASIATLTAIIIKYTINNYLFTNIIELEMPKTEIRNQLFAGSVMGGWIVIINYFTSDGALITAGVLFTSVIIYTLVIFKISDRFRTMFWDIMHG